ncbi:MAG: hypothetical protein LJE85_09140 [Gammaproteobacteria bacterium]|nr:hypothetical protein [Gammaproteobacteria bacterium]
MAKSVAIFSLPLFAMLCMAGVHADMITKCTFIALISIFAVGAAASGNETEGVTSSVNSTTLNRLIERAKEQILEDDGKQYWWRVFGKLDKISDDKIKACVSKKSNPEAMYKYVLEIGASGAIEKVHWEKTDDFTTCIDSVLTGMEMPAPPISPFYFYLSEI